MAEYLGRIKKSVLILLAEELEVNVSSSDKVRSLIRTITESSDYDEKLTKEILARILDEEKEKLARENEQREREERLAHELREFELEKLRIQNSAETGSTTSTSIMTPIEKRRIRLKDFVPRFDPDRIDITLFFVLFERQAKKENVEEADWVSQLIPLLPTDISEIIAREPVEKADDYKHIKDVLLKRFKLGAADLKLKLDEHSRKVGSLWVDLVYELTGYLDNWLESLEVTDFDSLKELILLEQLKKRIPHEIKRQYLDIWEDFKSPSKLAEKCDHFERVRKKDKNGEPKLWEKSRSGDKSPRKSKDCDIEDNGVWNGDSSKNHSRDKEKAYERKKEIYCYFCGQEGHIKPFCPEWKKNNQGEPLNQVLTDCYLGEHFKPFLLTAEINGLNRVVLKDSGAGLDLIDHGWTKKSDLTGETVWVKQPLDKSCKKLALAKVTIKGDFGELVTKAAVKPPGLDQGFYIMGNRTAQLLQNKTKDFDRLNQAVSTTQKIGLQPVGNDLPYAQKAVSDESLGTNIAINGSLRIPSLQMSESTPLRKGNNETSREAPQRGRLFGYSQWKRRRIKSY